MERKIRVLIADDDAGMRLLLSKLIATNDAFVIVAEATDGDAAVEAAKTHRPNVVFLDIDMPKRNGLSCAKEICEADPDVAVIFATAHDGYMSNAFELYAYDYLVKPFKADRVYQTLSRLESAFSAAAPVPNRTPVEKLTIKNRDGLLFIKTADIIFVERNDRVSTIVTVNGEYETAESLGDLEEKLDPAKFMRTHRSFLVNTSYVYKAAQYGRWSYALSFTHTDRQALITLDKIDELQEIL